MKVIYTFGIDQKPVEIDFKEFVSWLRRLVKTLGENYSISLNIQITDCKK